MTTTVSHSREGGNPEKDDENENKYCAYRIYGGGKNGGGPAFGRKMGV